jgi:hypothetical protein
VTIAKEKPFFFDRKSEMGKSWLFTSFVTLAENEVG